jgi:hypothetical protein
LLPKNNYRERLLVLKNKLAVTRQPAFSPMRFLARSIEYALNMAVQRSHDAHAREPSQAATPID